MLLLLLGQALTGISSAQNSLPESSHESKQSPRLEPTFSWDTVPLYMHIRKKKSYTKEELAFLSQFPLLTFEKSNGHGDHGSIEKGTLVSARAVKSLNPDTTILYYRNVIVHYGGYDVNHSLESIPDAFLQDQQGNQNLIRSQVPAYDLSNSKLRRWWVDACRDMTSDPAIDGLFLDGNIKALEPGYLAREVGKEKKAQVLAGYHHLMKETREAIGPKKLMVANILRARFDDAGMEYLNYFDGSYLEGFHHNVGRVSYEDYVVKGIDAMQRASQAGKIVAYTSGLARKENQSKMGIDEAHGATESEAQAQAELTYSLAIFLTAAGKYSYFRVHEGYSADQNQRWMRWFPEYDKPLGPPLGPAKKKGYQYRRSFQHAEVFLDVKERTAKITWR